MGDSVLLNNLFTPVNYNVYLKINHETPNFNGSITVDLIKSTTVKQDTKDSFEIQLHSSELVIMNATFTDTDKVEYKAKVSYDRLNEIAKFVVEGDALYSKDSLQLSINYIGKINSIRTFRDFTKGVFKTNYLDDRTNTSTNYVIATHSQASFARTIYPCVDDPSVKTTFELTIETLDRFKVLSNATPISRLVDESKSLQTVLFKKTPLMATSIFGFVVGDLDFIESKVKLANKEILIRYYTIIGEISGTAYGLDIAAKSLPFIESQFKLDYPLEKLDFIALPFLTDGAMENFGLVTLQSTYALTTSLANREATKTLRQLIVHEIIHHWLGNYVSFDHWDHLWLNETFATWFAYYVLYKLDLDSVDLAVWDGLIESDLENLLVQDATIPDIKPVVFKSDNSVKTTQDAMVSYSYQKGILIMRMVSNTFENDKFNDDLPDFVRAVSKFLKQHELKTITALDFWNGLDTSSFNVTEFVNSWLDQPGYPLLTVSINESNQVVVEQERFYEAQNIEDKQRNLYHVPLAIRHSDGSIKNQILTEKKVVLDITPEQFTILNANRIGFYRVHYSNVELYDNIVKNIATLSNADLVGVVSDLSRFIETKSQPLETSVIGLVKLSEVLASQASLQFNILEQVFTQLRVIEDPYKLFASKEKSQAYSNWLISLNLKLFQRLDWTNELSRATDSELSTRTQILKIGIETPEIYKVAESYFKKLLHGPSRSVPAPFLEPVLFATSLRASQTTWKKILELVKQPGATVNNIFGGSAQEIQNASILALGYTRDPALIKRVLNFVATNIESTMVELGITGLQYNRELTQSSLWDWFKLNYNTWTSKSLKPGSTLATHLKSAIEGITTVVVSGMITEDQKKQVGDFVEDKTKKFPTSDLRQYVDSVEEVHNEMKRSASSIDIVLKYVT